jgi:FkbM family methyltransferase
MSQVEVPMLWQRGGASFLWAWLTAHQKDWVEAGLDVAKFAFLGECLTHFGRSRAQLFQDCYVCYRLHDKRGGFFVEFGATDGKELSNSYMLEAELGWRGILAEPLPFWHHALAGNRRARIDHRCVWRRSGERLEFLTLHTIPELASLKAYAESDLHAAERRKAEGTFPVETVSLADLLAQHEAPEDIDYLSIDVEGAELDVLAGMDFDRYRPRIITIEHNFQPHRGEMQRLLESRGFVREFEDLSMFDDWYYHPARVA